MTAIPAPSLRVYDFQLSRVSSLRLTLTGTTLPSFWRLPAL